MWTSNTIKFGVCGLSPATAAARELAMTGRHPLCLSFSLNALTFAHIIATSLIVGYCQAVTAQVASAPTAIAHVATDVACISSTGSSKPGSSSTHSSRHGSSSKTADFRTILHYYTILNCCTILNCGTILKYYIILSVALFRTAAPF
jgi:hypothetical protein